MKQIKAIEIGWGESAHFYRVEVSNVTEIVKELLPYKEDADGVIEEIIVYAVYNNKGIICHIEAGSNLTIYYQ